MTGFYLYCLKDKTERKFSLAGMDGKKVSTLSYKDIEGVITEVNLAEFDPKKIKLKLEDLKWTKEKIRNHQKVIEEAMKDGPVIPLKFLTLYKSKAKINNILEKDYQKFRKLLDRLRDKTEWGMKIFIQDRERLTGAIREEDEEITKMEEDINSKPEGVKYFLEKKLNEKISEKIEEKLDKYLKDIFEVLSPFSVAEPVINKLLPREFTERNEEMVLNASYLIPNEKLEEFQKTIGRLNDYYSPRGLRVEDSGPWPPYSFVEHGDKNKNQNSNS